jgi:hypothetical protein
MWLFVVKGLVYLTLGILTGRFRRKLLPIHPGQVIVDVRAALRGRLSHDDVSVYNAVQKLLYLGVILAGVVVVLSGLAIWKPVQLQELTALFGGYDFARYVHFAAMAAIVGFLLIHVIMAFVVPKSLRAMIIGDSAWSGEVATGSPQDHAPLNKEGVMSRIRRMIPGVDPKLLIKDATKLLARSDAAVCSCVAVRASARSRSSPAATSSMLLGRAGADEDLLLQRSRAGLAVQPEPAGAHISGERNHRPVPVQCLLSGG